MKHYHNGKLYISTDELARDFTRRYGVKVLPKHINRICHHYKVDDLEWRGIKFFSNSGVINMREQKPRFSEVLDNVITFDNAYGYTSKSQGKANNSSNKTEDKPIDYTPKESDMEYVSNQLIDKYQTEGKKPRHIISEGAETKNMAAAKHYLYDKLKYDESQAMGLIGKIKTDIPNVRLGKCKFILGVTRMFCEQELTDGRTIMELNKTLKYVASDAHINEYDRNLNNLSVEELVKRFATVESSDLEAEKQSLGSQNYTLNSDYTIVRIKSFNVAEQYGKYTSWCITHYENMFDSYTSGGLNVFYFCLKQGFENITKKEGKNTPLDEYGLSMIAVSVCPDGSLNTSTCRWNHDNGGNDNILTTQELSNLLGVNFFNVFKPLAEEEIKGKLIKAIEEGQSSLKTIVKGNFVIPNGANSIGDSAFYGCTSLTSITIPESVIKIGGSAFSFCSGLTSITIPESVIKIGENAFFVCTSLASVTIPNGVTSISKYLFLGCSSLTSVTIPNSVTSIGGYAFYGCTSLTSVTIPNGVTSIGNCAFLNCSGLTSITIPESVIKIDGSAFYGCNYKMKIFVNTEDQYNYFDKNGFKNIRYVNDNVREGRIIKINRSQLKRLFEGASYDIKVGDNQTEGKIIRLTEGQYIRLFENSENEGFRLYKDGTYRFKPNSQENADTNIFNNDNTLKVNVMELPKSKVKCYNLYSIKNMSVNKALKHQKDLKGKDVTWYSDNENYSNTIEYFLKRSALYIRHLIGNSSIDYFTCPQSSSEFNKVMLQTISSYYPQSSGIILKPDMLVKNVRGIYVNTDYAKQLGMTDKEIHDLQIRVNKWHSDEDIRDKRRELDRLRDEIAATIATRKRGRPSLDFIGKQERVQAIEKEIEAMRKGKRGLDPTKDASGRMRPWQIKSLDDKDRRAIEGLFEINPEYNGIQSKLAGKTIVVFDDNISSGATMDDFCLKLKQLGVANILAFTLGTIDPTIYKQSERSNRL